MAALRPSLFVEVYPEQELDQAAQSLEKAIIRVIDEACESLAAGPN